MGDHPNKDCLASRIGCSEEHQAFEPYVLSRCVVLSNANNMDPQKRIDNQLAHVLGGPATRVACPACWPFDVSMVAMREVLPSR